MDKNVKEALKIAIAVIYLDDEADYETALWEIVEQLGGSEVVELLEKDEDLAYKKYVEGEW